MQAPPSVWRLERFHARPHARQVTLGDSQDPTQLQGQPADRGIPALPPTTPTPGSENLPPPNSGKSLYCSLRTVCAQQVLVAKQRPALGGRCGEEDSKTPLGPWECGDPGHRDCTEGGRTCSMGGQAHARGAQARTCGCSPSSDPGRGSRSAGEPWGAENVYVLCGARSSARGARRGRGAVHLPSPIISHSPLENRTLRMRAPQDVMTTRAKTGKRGLWPRSRKSALGVTQTDS